MLLINFNTLTASDHLFNFENLAFQIKLWASYVALPMWLINLFVTLISIIIVILIVIQNNATENGQN